VESDFPRPLTLARDRGAEDRAREALAALVSSAKDAAAEAWVGAALGGALGLGEGATLARGGGSGGGEPAAADPFELTILVDVPLRDVEALERRIRRAFSETAHARHVPGTIRAVTRRAIPLLPVTLENLELVAADRILDGPAGLLSAAPSFDAGAVDPAEGLRLLVRSGAALLAAERAVDRGADAAASRAALFAVNRVDLALGAAVLLSAGLWLPSVETRDQALRALVSGPAGGEARRPGFRARMGWTRFRDLVERHRAALSALRHPPAFDEPDARRQVARASDRWMEVLRLFEEERLGLALPTWTDLARALAARHGRSATASLFVSEEDAAPTLAGLPSRRTAKAWPQAERLAPAVAALLDWDPGDLPLVPVLLDLPDGSEREALRQRVIHLAAGV
jgi:hypothetical protein